MIITNCQASTSFLSSCKEKILVNVEPGSSFFLCYKLRSGREFKKLLSPVEKYNKTLWKDDNAFLTTTSFAWGWARRSFWAHYGINKICNAFCWWKLSCGRSAWWTVQSGSGEDAVTHGRVLFSGQELPWEKTAPTSFAVLFLTALVGSSWTKLWLTQTLKAWQFSHLWLMVGGHGGSMQAFIYTSPSSQGFWHPPLPLHRDQCSIPCSHHEWKWSYWSPSRSCLCFEMSLEQHSSEDRAVQKG